MALSSLIFNWVASHCKRVLLLINSNCKCISCVSIFVLLYVLNIVCFFSFLTLTIYNNYLYKLTNLVYILNFINTDTQHFSILIAIFI